MADISSEVGYQISHDTRLEVRTQFSRTADLLAAISRQIAVAQDTRVIIGLIQQAIGDIVMLARERRIITLSPEQRICRLPSEQRIIAIPSERRICRLTRSSL